jgi:hypothetical protein
LNSNGSTLSAVRDQWTFFKGLKVIIVEIIGEFKSSGILSSHRRQHDIRRGEYAIFPQPQGALRQELIEEIRS